MKFIFLVLFVSLLGCVPVFSQNQVYLDVVPPDLSNNEHIITSNAGGELYHVGNASLQLSSQYNRYTLNAFVYNDHYGNMMLNVKIIDSFSNIIDENELQIDDNSFLPDVIIRDNYNGNGAQWVVSVVYNKHNCPNDEIFLSNTEVGYTTIGNGALDFGNTSTISFGQGIYPRIDGFAEFSETIDGEYYAMKDFAIAFNNLLSIGNSVLYHLDENSNILSTITNPNFHGSVPDIACMTNLQQGGARYVYMVDMAGNELYLGLFDMTNNVMVTFDAANSYNTYNPIFRIDAHTIIDDFLHQNRYVITGTMHCNDFLLDDYYPNTGFNFGAFNELRSNSANYSFSANGGHSVTAGLGYYLTNLLIEPNSINHWGFTTLLSVFSSSGPGSKILMTDNFKSNLHLSPTNFDIYEVNNDVFYYTDNSNNQKIICRICSRNSNYDSHGLNPTLGNIRCGNFNYSSYYNASIATQPNAGDYTIACWIDESTNTVRFKQSNRYGNQGVSLMSGKTDNSTTEDGILLFPNPTNGKVTLTSKYAIESVRLVNILGKELWSYIFDNTDGNSSVELDLKSIVGSESVVFVELISNGKKSFKKVIVQ